MRRTTLRPVHRVAGIATVALVTMGMGVLGTSAAVADDLPTEVVPPVASAPVADAPAEAAPPADAPVEAAPTDTVPVEVEATEVPVADEAPAPTPSPVADEAQEAAVAPETQAPAGDVVGIAAATEPGTVTVTGTTGVGDLQTATTAGWPDGTTFTYQWTRDGEAVDGATGETYLLVEADAGRVVEVAVTGTGPAADDEPTTVTSERGEVAGSAPVFTAEPGTDLTVVAGQPYSFTWEAAGDPTPNVEIVADPSTLFVSLPEDAVVTQVPGSVTVSGTSTAAGRYSFAVTPLNEVGFGELLVVHLEVVPGQTIGLSALVGVYDAAAGSASVWRGDVESARYAAADEQVGTLVVAEGSALAILTYEEDAYENVTRAGSVEDLPLVESSSAADGIGTTGRESIIASSVTFEGAGDRTVTVTRAGLTITIPVDVRAADAAPTAAGSAPVAGSAAAGSVPVAASGHLAHTGAESSSLLALAAALLAAGTALTVVRRRGRVRL